MAKGKRPLLAKAKVRGPVPAKAKIPLPEATTSSAAATLPKELLEMILDRLDLTGHARFSLSCKWWRSVASENPPISKPFILLSSNNPLRMIRCLLRSIPTLPPWTEARFIGSIQEWLVLETDRTNLFLLKPALTEVTIIPLPPIPFQKQCSFRKVVLSSPPSSDKCLIVLREIDDCHDKLSFCRPGDVSTWTLFYQGEILQDILFFRDQLYILDGEGRMQVFDYGLNTTTDLEPFTLLLDEWSCTLVNAFDRLFVITLVGCKLFEIDLKNSSCTEPQSIGDDNMLFVQGIHCLALRARDYPEFKPNHIYYCSPSTNMLPSYSIADKTKGWAPLPENSRHLIFSTLFEFFD